MACSVWCRGTLRRPCQSSIRRSPISFATFAKQAPLALFRYSFTYALA
jgi:hypothetical protein